MRHSIKRGANMHAKSIAAAAAVVITTMAATTAQAQDTADSRMKALESQVESLKWTLDQVRKIADVR